MITLNGRDLRRHEDRHAIAAELDKCLVSLGMKGNKRKFIERSHAEPCTNPDVGRYIDTLGLDRVCDFYGADAEDIRLIGSKDVQVGDLLFINTCIAPHLDECRRCLALCRQYVSFIDTTMPEVEALANYVVDNVFDDIEEFQYDDEPLGEPDAHLLESDEEADYNDNMLAKPYIDKVYPELISVDHFIKHQEFLKIVHSLTCSKPHLWKYIEPAGILKLMTILPMNAKSLEIAVPEIQLEYSERMEVLTELSDHVGEPCPRCSYVYAAELAYEKHKRSIFVRMYAQHEMRTMVTVVESTSPKPPIPGH